RLVDIPASFRDPAFFDEVPLYSRYEQVEFLKQYGEVDRLLLELSLEYLQSVKLETDASLPERFIALAIIRDDPQGFIVPYIFICNSNAAVRLKGLRLSPPSKGLGKYIQSLVQKTASPQNYRVLEDRAIVPNAVRVFVLCESSPAESIPVKTFADHANM